MDDSVDLADFAEPATPEPPSASAPMDREMQWGRGAAEKKSGTRPPPDYTYTLYCLQDQSPGGRCDRVDTSAPPMMWVLRGESGKATYDAGEERIVAQKIDFWQTLAASDGVEYHYYTENRPETETRVWLFQSHPSESLGLCLIRYYFRGQHPTTRFGAAEQKLDESGPLAGEVELPKDA